VGDASCTPSFDLRILALPERLFDNASVARAYVELPDGWGPQRMVIVAFQRAGYVSAHPEVVKAFGRGRDQLLIPGYDEGPHGGGPLDT
jgi:hypothetical protein